MSRNYIIYKLSIYCLLLSLVISNSYIPVQAQTSGSTGRGNEKIFFISGPKQLGEHKLNIMNSDGSSQAAILPNFNAYVINYLPVISPLGDLVIHNSEPGYVEILDLDGNQVKKLIAPDRSTNPLSWSNANKQILFSVGSQEESEIYKLDYISERFTRLTNDKSKNFFATWSPDGTQIAYMSDYQLWLMDADGNHKRKLIEQQARKVAWSPNGKLIAFESSTSGDIRDFDIWVVNIDGTNLRNLTHTANLVEFDPVWSPDSTQVAYEASELNGDSQIYVVDLVSGEKHQLTEANDNAVVAWTKNDENESLESNSQVDLNPSKRKLAFVKDGNIWLIQEDGNGLTKLTSLQSEEFRNIPYTWSPTGRELAYIFNGDVYIIDLAHLTQRQVTANAKAEELDWHDSRIAVVRDVDNPATAERDVRISYVTLDKDTKKLTDVSPDLPIIPTEFSSDVRVRWSPDGKWIALSYSGLAGGIASIDGSRFIEDIGFNPTWKHQSSQLLYLKQIGKNPSDNLGIWLIDPVTQSRTQVAVISNYFAHYANYSTDDQYIVYSDPYLKHMKSDGTNQILLFGDRALNPTWSPQGDALVYVKWLPGESVWPNPSGIFVINADGTHRHEIVSGLATNPTWQPIPTDNGKLITLEPSLVYKAHTYSVQYRATNYNIKNAGVFFQTVVSAPDFLVRKGITQLTIRKDGIPLSDEVEISNILTLYTTAFWLYEAGGYPHEDLNSLEQEFKDFTEWWDTKLAVLITKPESGYNFIFGSRKEEIKGVVRAMTTPDDFNSRLTEYTNNTTDLLSRSYSVAEAVEKAAKQSQEPAISELSEAIGKTFKNWNFSGGKLDIFRGNFSTKDQTSLTIPNAQDFIKLGVNLVYTAVYAQDKINLFYQYNTLFQDASNALDKEQLDAIASVRDEAEDTWKQREQILTEFAADQAKQTGISLIKMAVPWALNRFGIKHIASYWLGEAATVGTLGITLGRLVVGVDQVYDHFKLGEQAIDFSSKFSTARKNIEKKAKAQGKQVYDGDMIESYRIAYQLEMMASAQAYRSYADGVEKTVDKGVASIINDINWFLGENWPEEVAEIRKTTEQMEKIFADDFVYPPFIKQLIALAVPEPVIKSSSTIEDSKANNPNEQTQTATTSTPLPAGSNLTAHVNVDTLNIRSGPSLSYPVISQVKKDISLLIQSRNSDASWLQVCCVNGQPGWVINNPDYVRVDGVISTLPITPSKSEEAEPTAKPNPSSQPCKASVDSNFVVLYSRASKAAGCPSTQAFLTKMAYQPFQQGFMIWRPGTNGDAGGQIYVIYNSGQWKSFNDKWAAGMPVSGGYTAPNGLYEPVHGFGLLWRTQLGGPDGTIGWALGQEKGSDNGRIQTFTNGSVILNFPEQAPILLLSTGKWLR